MTTTTSPCLCKERSNQKDDSHSDCSEEHVLPATRNQQQVISSQPCILLTVADATPKNKSKIASQPFLPQKEKNESDLNKSPETFQAGNTFFLTCPPLEGKGAGFPLRLLSNGNLRYPPPEGEIFRSKTALQSGEVQKQPNELHPSLKCLLFPDKNRHPAHYLTCKSLHGAVSLLELQPLSQPLFHLSGKYHAAK